MFDKRIGIEIGTRGNYRKSIVPYDSRQTYGKMEISCTGSLIMNELAQQITLELTNYYPDDLVMNSDRFYTCRVALGYADSPNRIGYLEGEVINAYVEYKGVDSKTVIQVNTGISKTAYARNVKASYEKGASYSAALSQLKGLGIGVSTSISTAKGLGEAINYEGNAMDYLVKLKRIADSDNLAFMMTDGVLYVFDMESGNKKIHTIKNVLAPIRRNDGGIDVTVPYDPTIRVGDLIRVDSKYYVSTQNLFVSKLTDTFYIYQIDFGFSTTGSMNYMNIRGSIQSLA